MSKLKDQVENNELEIDFDTLADLAKNKPGDFEVVRSKLINDFIKSLPEERRHRMECLQWRIDRTRDKSKTALSSCMAITEMMWESFEQLNTLLMEMKNSKSRQGANMDIPMKTAEVIPFQMN